MTLAEQHLSYWLEELEDPSFVYVIQGDPGTPIKVGVAKDPHRRMAGLQTGNPQELRLLHIIPGDHKLEASLHHRLKDSLVRGEWFGGKDAEAFIKWAGDYAQKSMRVYKSQGRLPSAPPVPKRIQRLGFNAYGSRTSRLGHRWRTGDDRETPVTIRFVEPEPRKPEGINEKLAQAAAAGFSSYEIDRLRDELKHRAA